MAGGQEKGDFVDLVLGVLIWWETNLAVGGDVEGYVEGVRGLSQYLCLSVFEGDRRALEGWQRGQEKDAPPPIGVPG